MEQLSETTHIGERRGLSSVLRVACVAPLEPGSSKQQALFQLLSALVNAGAISRDSIDVLVAELLLREEIGTSAWGNGLAFPNTRTWMVNRPVGALGTAPGGLDFGALDGLSTRLMILLLSPYDQREQHAEIMGHLAALIHDRTLPYWLQATRSARELLAHLGLEDY